MLLEELSSFHDTALGSGSMPHNVLEDNVEQWIESKR